MSAFLRAVSPGAMALRVLVLVAPVLALVSTAVQGPGPRVVLVVLVTVLAAGGAGWPESGALTAALGLVVFWWALAARGAVPVTVIGAAWLLLAAHLAAVVLAYGPRELPVDPGMARLWLRRGLALAVAPPALWLLAVAVDGRADPADVWLAGLAAGTVVCVVAAVAVHERGPT